MIVFSHRCVVLMCNDCTSFLSYSWCLPWCISSLVNDASWSPRSCKYIQSGFGQLWFRIKCEQYFVVPSDVFTVRPSTTILFTASIALNASSERYYQTKFALKIRRFSHLSSKIDVIDIPGMSRMLMHLGPENLRKKYSDLSPLCVSFQIFQNTRASSEPNDRRTHFTYH